MGKMRVWLDKLSDWSRGLAGQFVAKPGLVPVRTSQPQVPYITRGRQARRG
jgi:hypothetical protein